ncbi:MAG: FecR domain-containing protein [archaeon]|jgi:ribosomal 50S subunit-recycling heat shock protein|nr:FecR domain-containing protein [archaeon]
MSKTKRKVLITFGIIAAAVLVVAIAGYWMVTSSPTVSAQLHVESGSVLVNDALVKADMELNEGDSIETRENSEATVILYESVIVSLDESTKITLSDLAKEHPKITQESGSTWNKFTKLLGMQQYSIDYGNSVASVRGTAFGLRRNRIIGGEGEVDYLIDGIKYRVRRNRVVENLGNGTNERNATENETNEIRMQNERTIRILKIMRENEMQKHPRIIEMIKSQANLTDSGIREMLEEADDGKVDIDEAVRKSPIDIESVHRVAEITKRIRELKLEMAGNITNG